MMDTEQRRQWAEHIKDEVDAIARQQQTAGVTHTPLERPHPYTADELAVAVGQAVAAERERCARLAESWSEESRLLGAFGDFTEWELRAGATVARAVAGQIRDTVPPGRSR